MGLKPGDGARINILFIANIVFCFVYCEHCFRATNLKHRLLDVIKIYVYGKSVYIQPLLDAGLRFVGYVKYKAGAVCCCTLDEYGLRFAGYVKYITSFDRPVPQFKEKLGASL